MSTDTYFYKFDNYLEFTTKESKANNKSGDAVAALTLVGDAVGDAVAALTLVGDAVGDAVDEFEGAGVPEATRFRLLVMYPCASERLKRAIVMLFLRNRSTTTRRGESSTRVVPSTQGSLSVYL
eukprot:CAMPEP_0203780340 /NCGR_PEP_ID=MMETSP0099_2-20121227/9378_1 /ASSEMBLY_ACC=CAM_ASM_000209 /TAXON_ID=96639 /ORGANISM=" , Strain NY0313808BC1" /LENGTH=123 /DNA_ID=CAMNT_0050680709 /DNA_START=144 /DNA_END=515 /DNA_ORIENTATION=+